MCQLGASTALRTSTTQFDPSTHGTTETGSTVAPSTGRLGTDELSIGQPATSHDTSVRQSVDEAAQISHSSPVSSSAVGEPSSAVSAAPPRADADLVAQVAKASVPAPSLKDVLAKAGAAKAPESGSTPEPVRLPTSAEVRAKYGEAKDDIKIFGQKIYGMSTEYKGILKALDAYHKAAAEIDVNTASPADIKKLNDLLDRAEFAIGSYHGKREGVGDLAQGVAQERALLLKAKTEGAAEGVSFGAAAAGLQEKQLGTGGPQYQAIMEDARGLQGFLDKIPVGNGSGAAVKVLSEGLKTLQAKIEAYGGDRPEIADLKAAVADSRDRLGLLEAHPELLAGRVKGANVAMNWGKALQVAPALVSGLDGGAMKGKVDDLKILGKGAVNTVYLGEFQKGEDVKKEVVKFDLPAFPSFYDPSQEMQIPGLDAPNAVADLHMNENDPQLLQRAVASDDVAKALGFSISVPVRMAVIDGSLAGIMEKAPGVANDKNGPVAVIKQSDVQAHAQVKKDAYVPMEGKIGGVQARLVSEGHNDKLIGGIFKDLRTRVQEYNPPPKAEDIAGLSASEFKAAYGAVVGQQVGKERQYFGLVLTEGGVGMQRVSSGGTPVEGTTPQLLMSKEDFTDIVRSGNEGRAQVDAKRALALDGKVGWERDKSAELLDRGAGHDGKVNQGALRGMKVGDDGFIAIDRDQPYDIPYDSPDMVQNLVQLQITDFLTGQVDRHQGNYFVHKGPDGKLGIGAIDGDFSWGDKPVDNPVEGGPKYVAPHFGLNHARDLPPVIDSKMKEQIENLKGAKLEELKANLGQKLSASQIEAFEERLTALQAHVASDKCKVISPDAWGTDPDVKAGLKDEKSSYAAREIRMMADYKKAGYPLEPPPWG